MSEFTGIVVVVHAFFFKFGRNLSPRVDVEVFLYVFFGVSFGDFRNGGREVSVLGSFVVEEIVFLFTHEETVPVFVNRFNTFLFNGVVFQNTESGVS